MPDRIADDFVGIAQRLRELEAERGTLQPMPETTTVKCAECRDLGWVSTTVTPSGWRRCTYCEAGYEKLRPGAQIRKA